VARYNKYGKKIHRLSDLKIFEVSLVDKPANGRKFILFKRLSDPSVSDLDDHEVAERVQSEWEAADEAAQQRILRQVERLEALLDLQTLQKHLSILDPFIRKQILADEGWGWDYDAETGAFKKNAKGKLTPLDGSETKTHVFNFETGKWKPKKQRR
jgi:hypothetical protein